LVSAARRSLATTSAVLAHNKNVSEDSKLLLRERARETGLRNGRLRPCPGTPNCVVSEYRDKESHTEPLAFSGEPGAAWESARAKAGVYAVRQGPVLAENLMRLLREQTPLAHKPQRRFLSLLSLGERRAVASWGDWAVEGAWVWKLKDRGPSFPCGECYSDAKARCPH
jgi:hypothetical protein